MCGVALQQTQLLLTEGYDLHDFEGEELTAVPESEDLLGEAEIWMFHKSKRYQKLIQREERIALWEKCIADYTHLEGNSK